MTIAATAGVVALMALTLGALLVLAPAGDRWPWAEGVRSDSMAPAVRVGDLVILRPADPSALEVGDVVLFRDDGGARVLHRIVAGTPAEGWTTQGDANAAMDSGVVHSEDVEGELAFRIPRAAAALSGLRGPVGILVLVVLPSAFVLVAEGRRLLRARDVDEPGSKRR